MDVVTLHSRTVAEFVARANAIAAGQWDQPTPCTDWNVRELVNHLVNEDRWTPPMLAGRTIAEVGDQFDGDLLGTDPLAAVHDATREAVRSAAELGPAGGTVHLSYGDEDMAEYLHQLAADHLIHAWDLAAAVGGDTKLDAELVAAVAEWFASREQLYRSAGVIGPAVAVTTDDPVARLIAAFGRDPSWAPPR
jgi:uncharacterized protein (TIGR03086 family)